MLYFLQRVDKQRMTKSTKRADKLKTKHRQHVDKIKADHKEKTKLLNVRWRERLKNAVANARDAGNEKVERLKEKHRAAKEHKRQKFWKTKADNIGINKWDASYGSTLW